MATAEQPPVFRAERQADRDAVREILSAAFGGTDEVQVVEMLREDGGVLVSLVADLAGVVVGHVLFSRAEIDWGGATQSVAALGPMAVAPHCQRQGIGAGLVTAGLAACRASGETAVVVLGHPTYYPKFGFVQATERGLQSDFGGPPEAFMVLELTRDALAGKAGLVKYAPAFYGF